MNMDDNNNTYYDDLIKIIEDTDANKFNDLVKLAKLDPAVDFRFANLHDIDFSYQDLKGFDFTGAAMTGCIFNQAVISGAQFENAKLDKDALRRARDWKNYSSALKTTQGSENDLMLPFNTSGQDLVRVQRMDNAHIEEIRRALRSSNIMFSYKSIFQLLERSGLGLKVSADALRRFGDSETKRLTDPDDLRKLSTFFFATETGRLLRKSPGEGTGTLDRFIEGLRIRLPSDRAQRVDGKYFAFHGSITKRSHFTVQYVQVKRQRDAIVQIRTLLRSDTSQSNNTFFQSEGFLSFDRQHFQILMLNRNDNKRPNNLVGLSLIVFDEVDPFDGPVMNISANMLGLTKNGHYFTRAVRIERIDDAITDEKIINLTGDYDLHQIPSDFIPAFIRFVQNLPEERNPDPIFELRTDGAAHKPSLRFRASKPRAKS